MRQERSEERGIRQRDSREAQENGSEAEVKTSRKTVEGQKEDARNSCEYEHAGISEVREAIGPYVGVGTVEGVGEVVRPNDEAG